MFPFLPILVGALFGLVIVDTAVLPGALHKPLEHTAPVELLSDALAPLLVPQVHGRAVAPPAVQAASAAAATAPSTVSLASSPESETPPPIVTSPSDAMTPTAGGPSARPAPRLLTPAGEPTGAPLSLVASLAQKIAALVSIVSAQQEAQKTAGVPEHIAASGNGGPAAGGYILGGAVGNTPASVTSLAASAITGTLTNVINSALATIDDLTTNELVAVNATSTTLYVSGTTSLATTSIASLIVSSTTTSAGLRISTLDCSSFGNGGTLTTDGSGNVICATDDGGAGGTVAGADTQVQFNNGGVFGASAGFTFASTSARLTVTNASTTNISAIYASSTNLSAGAANIAVLTLGSLAGPLHAQGGVISATSSIGTAYGGTGLTSVASSSLLIGSSGNTWIQMSTSTLGLPTFSDLSSYLALAAWYATTTSDIEEGTNLYFTWSRATTSFVGNLAATTSVNSITTLNNLSILSSQVSNFNASTDARIGALKDWNILFGALTPTTTLGILVSASSTIGNGTQAGGLTIAGGATTTGNAYFAGNVGIGTTAPESPLDVFGVLRSTDATATPTTGTGLEISYNVGSAMGRILAYDRSGSAYKNIGLGTNSGAQLYLKSDGNVGIGTTSPFAKLSVVGETVASHFTATTTATSTFPNLLSTNATTTNLNVGGVASTTNLFGAGLSLCQSGNVLTYDGAGRFGCAADQTAAGQANDFTFATNYGSISTATTSPLWAQSGLFASSTSHFVNFDAANATTTTLSVAGIASTSNLVASNSFTLGSLSGFLKATAGAVATAFIDLASDVTGILSVANGGTGWASIASAAIPYGNGTGALATTTAGTNGQVLALLNGVPTWAATSTLSTISGTLDVSKGGTGATSFSYGLVLSPGGTGALTNIATSSLGLLTTNVAEGSNLYYLDSRVQSFIHASTTIPKTYASNIFTGDNLFLASTTIGNGTQAGGLTINGGATTTGNLIVQGTGNTTFAGKVGIGTTSPWSTLSVQGPSGSSILQTWERSTVGVANLGIGSNNGVNYVFLGPLNNGEFYITDQAKVGVGTTTPWAKLSITNTGTGPSFLVEDSTSPDTSPFIIDASGNVGIGTSTPDATLNIVGPSGNQDVLVKVNTNSGGEDSRLFLGESSLYGMTMEYDGASNVAYIGMNNAVEAGLDTYSKRIAMNLSGSEIYFPAGDVGVGTTTPWAQLSINPNGITGPAFAIGSSTATSFIITNGGRAGVGTAAPSARLHVEGSQGDDTIGTEDVLVLGRAVNSGVTYQKAAAFALGTYGTSGNSPYSRLDLKLKSTLSSDYTADNTVLTLLSDGNVGIGTTSPMSRLSVKASSNSTTDYPLTITNSAGTTGFQIGAYGLSSKSVIDSNIDYTMELTNNLLLLPDGNVGIGTTSPWAQLSINPNGITGPAFAIGSSTATSFIVTNGGNVGIGISAPTARLHVNDATDITPDAIAAGQVRISGNGYSGFLALDASAMYVGHNSASRRLDLMTDETSRLSIAAAGNIGIGTTSPGAKLHVYGTDGLAGGSIRAESTAADSDAYFTTDNDANVWTAGIDGGASDAWVLSNAFGLGTPKLSVLTTGNVGIGTTSPWRTLSVTGTVGFSSTLSAESGSDNYLCIDPTTYEVTNGGANCAASSLRYKENIQDLTYGLDDVLALRPVSFQWTLAERPDDRSTQVGFIAEEMNGIVPEIVEYNASGTPESIDYDKLTSVLARAIQQIATITGTFKTNLIAWLADATNGISSIVAKVFKGDRAEFRELCVDDICVTRDQFAAVFGSQSASASQSPPLSAASTTEPQAATEQIQLPSSSPPSTEPTGPDLQSPPEPANDKPAPPSIEAI